MTSRTATQWSTNGASYDPALKAADKDGYDNLILLCGTCHKLIDADPDLWPVGCRIHF